MWTPWALKQYFHWGQKGIQIGQSSVPEYCEFCSVISACRSQITLFGLVKNRIVFLDMLQKAMKSPHRHTHGLFITSSFSVFIYPSIHLSSYPSMCYFTLKPALLYSTSVCVLYPMRHSTHFLQRWSLVHTVCVCIFYFYFLRVCDRCASSHICSKILKIIHACNCTSPSLHHCNQFWIIFFYN